MSPVVSVYTLRSVKGGCVKEKRGGKGFKKKQLFLENFPLPALLSALCVGGVTASPGVISPPRAFVPSAHSAAPKAQRLQQHNTIMAKKREKKYSRPPTLHFGAMATLAAAAATATAAAQWSDSKWKLYVFFLPLLLLHSPLLSSQDGVTFVQ